MIERSVKGFCEPAAQFLAVEQGRLDHGVADNDVVLGHDIDVLVASFDGDARLGLEKIKHVVGLANAKSLEAGWPSDAEWRSLLPAWFVKHFAPDLDTDELDMERAKQAAMSVDARHAYWARRRPRLQNWHFAMSPDQRYWLWWDGRVVDSDTLVLEIDNTGDSGGPMIPWVLAELISAAGGEFRIDLHWTEENGLMTIPQD